MQSAYICLSILYIFVAQTQYKCSFLKLLTYVITKQVNLFSPCMHRQHAQAHAHHRQLTYQTCSLIILDVGLVHAFMGSSVP